MKDAGNRRHPARIEGRGSLLCSKLVEAGVGVALTRLRVLDNHRHDSGKSGAEIDVPAVPYMRMFGPSRLHGTPFCKSLSQNR
jgi:hypothetical protein